MKTTQFTTMDQFTLLSDQTKRRINSLIGMKLTPQTIALFAQEYEDYDFDVRLQIAELINFLINKELTEFVNDINKDNSNNDVLIQVKKREYQERAENIKKLQDVLVNNRSLTNASENFEKQKESKTSKKTKTTIKTTLPSQKIDDSKRPSLIEEQKSKKVEKVVKPKVEKIEKPKVEKLVKPKVEKIEKPKVEKPKINADELVKQQKEAIEKRIQKEKEEYEKQQLEKEKLWRELYGKSRNETHDARNGVSNGVKKADSKDEQNKIPLMKDPKLTTYKLHGYTYSIEELIDPKNKVYLFWVNYKHKYFVGNLFSNLENIKPSLQKKLWKKRNKWIKKFHLDEKNKVKTTKLEAKTEEAKLNTVKSEATPEVVKTETNDGNK